MDNPFALALQTVKPSVQDETEISKLINTAPYMPRLQLVNGNSKYAKSADWKLTACHFYVMKATAALSIDMGTSPVIVPVDFRMKAVEETVSKEGSKWINYFDVKSDDFQRVVAQANLPNNTGYFWGPEYLIWVDGAGPEGGMWCTLMCGSKSARMNMGELSDACKTGRILSLPTRVHTSGKYSYEVFDVTIANVVLQNPPSQEDIIAQINKFREEAAAGVSAAPGPEVPQ